jgi:hypothetical protein
MRGFLDHIGFKRLGGRGEGFAFACDNMPIALEWKALYVK